MSIKVNPLVVLIEESIRLRDSAQAILSDAAAGEKLTGLERLVLISTTEEEEPRTASQISRNLGRSRQVVLRAANRLVELGLLKKISNPDHKTSPLLKVTAKGLKYEKQVGGSIDDIVNALFSASDLKQCSRMSKEIRKFRNILENYERE